MISASVAPSYKNNYFDVAVGNIETARICKTCGTPLETYGKNTSIGGGTYSIGWYPISELISPDYFMCPECYDKRNK